MKKMKPEAWGQDIKRAMDLLRRTKENKLRREFTMEENLLICHCIVKYEWFAYEFFFKTLTPMMKGFVNKIKNGYGAEVSCHDVTTIAYTEIYNGGRWTRMNSYKGRCSIFSWVALAASQVITPRLIDEGIISLCSKRTTKNTSLTLKSMKNKDERQLLIDLVAPSQWHNALTCVYVKDMSMGEAMRELGMTANVFRNTLSVAKKLLKEQLIAKESILLRRENGKVVNLVSLALHDTSIVTESLDDEGCDLDRIHNVLDDDERDFRKDVLNIIYPGEPTKMQWHKFVFDHAMQMKWSTEKETVWVARYFDNVSSKELAKQLGRRPSWVDNVYSRCNKELANSIRTWWKL